MAVDVSKSTWNSTKSAKLFSEASIPSVNNNVNQDGFKAHYPPALATQPTVAVIEQADRSSAITALIATIAAMGALALWRRRACRVRQINAV